VDPLAATSLLVAGVILGGAVFATLLYDLIMYLQYGNRATISRAVWVIGRDRLWVQWLFLTGCISVTVFLAWHFWWSP